jgi:uncharacterized protein with PIN domain
MFSQNQSLAFMSKEAPKHKRCPRCNQRLLVIDGEIEAHMEIPSAYGSAPKQCLPKNKAT